MERERENSGCRLDIIVLSRHSLLKAMLLFHFSITLASDVGSLFC